MQPDRVAKVDNLVFAITPDASVRYAKLRTNECQIARYPNPSDLAAMRANRRPQGAGSGDRGDQLHPLPRRQKPFDDRRVRRGAGRGDRSGQPGEGGVPGQRHARRVTGATGAVGPQWRPEAIQYDPAEAKKLLAEAGYPNGFTIDLWAIPVVRAYMPNGRRTAEMIQADWAKIGVTREYRHL